MDAPKNPQLQLTPQLIGITEKITDALIGPAPEGFTPGIMNVKKIELRYQCQDMLRRLILLSMREGARQVMGITPQATQLNLPLE